jgi:RNA 2',3'-cyclic 3'-phosphodiesterase
MRVFIALDIGEEIRKHIVQFLEHIRGFAPEARWTKPESLHVTLKFIGERPAEVVEEIKQGLSSVQGEKIELNSRGFGWFPTAKSARVFWAGVESGPRLETLARSVEDVTNAMGIPQEEYPFSPHLTLARRAGGSGSPRWRKGDRPHEGFQRLHDKLAASPVPEFGRMTAHEFYLYESQLSRDGARYNKIARFALS